MVDGAINVIIKRFDQITFILYCKISSYIKDKEFFNSCQEL